MKVYEKRLLNKLIDKYERSSLYYQKNQRNQNITLDISKKIFPEYYDESSLDYVEINETFKILEEKGWIKIIWRNNIKNHIISKVKLNLDALNSIYKALRRTPKSRTEETFLKRIKKFKRKSDGLTATSAFLEFLEKRVIDGKSVKTYVNVSDLSDFNDLINGLISVESNRQDYYIREFSIQTFGDSKRFEKLMPRILKVLATFDSKFSELDHNLILEEFHIFKNPNYVFLKGNVWFEIGFDTFDISGLKQGLAISGEDIENLEFLDGSNAKEIITIENFTTFARWIKPQSLIIYLGGYHNKERRELLSKVYKAFPEARYFHFGDIDVGGFQIYLDLVEKTGIPFKPYLMSQKELIENKNQAKLLTKNDRSRLEQLISKVKDLDSELPKNEILATLEYMKNSGYKLEQEAIPLLEYK